MKDDVVMDFKNKRVMLHRVYSKTHRTWKCTTISVPCENSPLFPFQAMFEYIQVRPLISGSFFCHLRETFNLIPIFCTLVPFG